MTNVCEDHAGDDHYLCKSCGKRVRCLLRSNLLHQLNMQKSNDCFHREYVTTVKFRSTFR